MKMLQKFSAMVIVAFIFANCGVNSVTKKQLENVKAGDVLVYRFQKDGKSWFYADKIMRVEGDKIYYNPGKMEANKGNDISLMDFVADRELSISKAELLKYETEQGDKRKVVIWIK
ncbi:hypothetical protein BH20ACI4_BH20ACI4_30570 [soil metagenome]